MQTRGSGGGGPFARPRHTQWPNWRGWRRHWRGGGGECWREELGRMNLIKKWRLFKGISDSDQAAVSPQAEAGWRSTAADTFTRQITADDSAGFAYQAQNIVLIPTCSTTSIAPHFGFYSQRSCGPSKLRGFYCLFVWVFYQLRPSADEKVSCLTMCCCGFHVTCQNHLINSSNQIGDAMSRAK